MKFVHKKFEEKAEKAISDKLLELEKANAEVMKAKIDDFVLNARLWIKEEVKECVRNELETRINSDKRVKDLENRGNT